MSKRETTSGKCYFCEAPVGPDSFCHGCRQFICDECGTNPETSGHGHDPETHRDDPSDE